MAIRRKPIGSYDIVGTEVINNDVFQDRFDVHPREIKGILKTDLPELWLANPDIYEILKNAEDLGAARMALYDYLNKSEDKVFREDNDYHILEKATIRECVRAFKSIIGPINEKRTKASALSYLFRLAQGASPADIPELSRDFLVEFVHLFRGVAGLSGIYSLYGVPEKRSVPAFIAQDGTEAALSRSNFLDKLADGAERKIRKYPSGLDKSVMEKRRKNKTRILSAFGGTEQDWQDYRWHLKHVVKRVSQLAKVSDLTDDEVKAVQIAEQSGVPFGLTPYYASLMDKDKSRKYDSAVRAQVIPPVEYAEFFARHKTERGQIMDFMGNMIRHRSI